MYDLNHQMYAERLKDLEREAEKERLARNVQKSEKNLLQNALSSLNLFADKQNKNR